MKTLPILKLFLLLTVVGTTTHSWAQNPENWTSEQLIAPSDLAQVLSTKKEVPVIISVGPGALIPGSVDAGMASKSLDKLKEQLQTVPKGNKVVIYCGCCPFEHCPNVRPAIETLQEMKFTNYYLLNLPNNIKQDWIDKGYPVAKQ